MLRDEQHGAAPLAADGEALREAQDHEERRRPVADLVERREASHEERRDADEDDRELQELLATVLVAEVPEDDAAERTGDEADRVGEERGDDGRIRVVRRREHDEVEHERRGGGEEEELVPLDDRSGHRGCDDAAKPTLLHRCVGAVDDAMR